MVGLRRATGNQRIGAMSKCIGSQKLQLARLVAAWRQAEHIVALDPDIWASAVRAGGAQSLGEIG